ncbi:hypothetical protein H6F89_29605 [Cyanobacteria bacterium FACHB-63]|nr:hypothetical protein [Cyanobacteria bacterium FACHB-63]
MLSDLELIQAFVTESIQQHEVLLSNHQMQAQQVGDCNQLVVKGEGLVLYVQLSEAPSLFWVKFKASYWELINQVLVSHQFMWVRDVDARGFHPYQFVKLPKGYQLHCAPAGLLWRMWWKYKQQIVRHRLSLVLLVRIRGTWYPIRAVECGHGFIYIHTLGNELQLGAEDMLVWLSPEEQKPSIGTRDG